MSKRPIEPGQTFEVKYPFVFEEYEDFGPDGPFKTKSWKPGVRMEPAGPYGEDVDGTADGEGAMILSVVSTHRPGRFPERVFYTRRWIDPRGSEFGKTKLHIATAEKFRRLAGGYAYPYVVNPCMPCCVPPSPLSLSTQEAGK